MLEIVPVPVLRDNYVWLMHDPASLETVAVDPSVADPVIEAAAARGWKISQVWNTHWHPDHTGGNDAIRAAYAPYGDRTPAELARQCADAFAELVETSFFDRQGPVEVPVVLTDLDQERAMAAASRVGARFGTGAWVCVTGAPCPVLVAGRPVAHGGSSRSKCSTPGLVPTTDGCSAAVGCCLLRPGVLVELVDERDGRLEPGARVVGRSTPDGLTSSPTRLLTSVDLPAPVEPPTTISSGASSCRSRGSR